MAIPGFDRGERQRVADAARKRLIAAGKWDNEVEAQRDIAARVQGSQRPSKFKSAIKAAANAVFG